MNHKSFSNLTHQCKASSEAFEAIAKIMYSILSFPCSRRHNSLWGSSDVHNSIMSICLRNSYAESGLKRLAVESGNCCPSGSWIRKRIRKIPQKTMQVWLHHAMDSTVSKLKDLGVFERPVTVAIDKHLIPRYDRMPDDSLVRSKPKNSTKIFESYCTMQSVSQVRAQLGCYPLYDGSSSNARFVRKLIDDAAENQIAINLVLLDREFFTVGAIHEIKQRHLRFLMPATRTAGIKKAITEFVDGQRESISRYTMTSSSGHVESFTLVIMPNRNPRRKSDLTEQYIVFATNIPAREISGNIHRIPSDYKKRWGIETGYACVGRLRPKTTSKNRSIRLLYFYYSLILYNAWVIANLILSKESPAACCKPVISIELLKCFIIQIIIESFANKKRNHYLECVT